jgi:hypothetical protein
VATGKQKAELGEWVEGDDELTFALVFDGETVELCVRLDGASVEAGLDVARRVTLGFAESLQRARQQLDEELRGLVNGGYLAEGQAPITKEEFLRRATLTGVTADADGNLWFDFDDDDMLWGHNMSVTHSADSGAWAARMWG